MTSKFGPRFLGSFCGPFGLITIGTALTRIGPESTKSRSKLFGMVNLGRLLSIANGLRYNFSCCLVFLEFIIKTKKSLVSLLN